MSYTFGMKILQIKWRNARSAFRAFLILAREETTFQIQMVGVAMIFLLSFVLRISHTEWLIIILAMGVALAIEALNTALEELCDHVTPEEHPNIGKVKDLGATASSLFELSAIAVVLLIFIPRFLAII